MDAAAEPEPIPAEAATLAESEPGVDPEPVKDVKSIADLEPAAGGFSESELRILRAWSGYLSEYACDVEFLGAFGFPRTTVPNYFKGIAGWFIDDTLGRQDLMRALIYLEGQGLLLPG